MKFLKILPALLLVFLVVRPAMAAGVSLGVANYISVADQNVSDGDIITSSQNGYRLSKTPYDALVVGVVSENPAISIGEGTGETFPVVSGGMVVVKVSGINGNIKKNDPVATSGNPGTGMKAVKAGYVLGTAMENADFGSKDEVKKIKVSLNIHYFAMKYGFSDNLLDIFNLSAIATYQEPLRVFRYVTAAVVAILAFVLGFLSFGRTAGLGVEALGRNPRAGKMIQFGIFLNMLITVAIIAIGLIISLAILRV